MALTDQIHPLGQPIRTAGDLWKALHLGLQFTTTPDDDALAASNLRKVLDVLTKIQECRPQSRWSDVMSMLIASVQLSEGIDKLSVVHMPISRFADLADYGIARFDDVAMWL